MTKATKRFQFDLASPDDDEQLRDIVATNSTPGSIELCFLREPSFFDSLAIEGSYCQVIVCRDTWRGCLVGFGIRSIRDRYVNGVSTPIGYLSGLRVRPEYRSTGLVARGYQFFRELHQDKRTEMYLTTIAEDNHLAIKILASGRAGLPLYHDAGQFFTRAIPVPRRASRPRDYVNELCFRPAKRLTRELLAYLQAMGRRRQFFPVYSQQDLEGSDTSLPGLDLENTLVALRDNQVVAAAASWDQRRFRQTVVKNYSPPLRRMRPLFNAWQTIRHLPGLPQIGQTLNNLPVAFPSVVHDDPLLFRQLIQEMVARRAGTDVDCLLVGVHQSDPLAASLHRLPGLTYTTRLFLVCWDDGEALRQSLDGRPMYLELGSL